MIFYFFLQVTNFICEKKLPHVHNMYTQDWKDFLFTWCATFYAYKRKPKV